MKSFREKSHSAGLKLLFNPNENGKNGGPAESSRHPFVEFSWSIRTASIIVATMTLIRHYNSAK